jgi:Zn-dependent peptidase ImmA (M78 family)
MIRVEVQPELLKWAWERSRLSGDALHEHFPQFDSWIKKSSQPTLRQVEDFAKTTHTPVGFLFLKEPPVERVPIPDFRTVAGKGVERPSPELLDTIYICQQRQEWYRGYANSLGETPLSFVGSASVKDSIVETASKIRHELKFDIEERRLMHTWTDALRSFLEQADSMGILVMSSGVVLNNNRRRLDPSEFRGFAMSDGLAPLVFINGADTKSAQMFTLAHELAHIWIGESAVSDAQPAEAKGNAVELWCNEVAAELLVPIAVFRKEYQKGAALGDQVARLARRFKVSTLVVLRRIHDVDGLTKNQFWDAVAVQPMWHTC